MATYYPTSLLVTGFDIIFFWVARMMMMGLYFMGDVPFRDVYIHALIRDTKGQKMSKSKGNVIDPLELIDSYGADALRFTMAQKATPGRDIKLGKEHVEGGRNFVTKLWNAARYVLMNGATYDPNFDPRTVKAACNQWILMEFQELLASLEDAYAHYHIHVISKNLYQFVWRTYCDWYVEITKPLIQNGSPEMQAETRGTLGWILAQLLHVLHPVIPFVTEEIWHEMAPTQGRLIGAAWPTMPQINFQEGAHEMSLVIDLIARLRTLKADLALAPGTFLTLYTWEPQEQTRAFLRNNEALLTSFGRIESIKTLDNLAQGKGMAQMVLDRDTFFIPLVGLIDVDAETQRLSKMVSKIDLEMAGVKNKLADEQFTKRAPAAIIEEAHERLLDLTETKDRLAQSLERIKGVG